MAVFIFFLSKFNLLINIYTQILTITNGVFSHWQKYINRAVLSRNIPVSLLSPKKGEPIFRQITLLLLEIGSQGGHVVSSLNSMLATQVCHPSEEKETTEKSTNQKCALNELDFQSVL